MILGAGLTGLSCAHHLGDRPYRLIERERAVGGLARTRTRPQGFLCDGTGHWLHLRSPEIRNLVTSVLEGNLAARQRRARVFSKERYTLYPFQANTYGLPKEVVAQCLGDFMKAHYASGGAPARNYQEWILQTFGDGICEHFMIPYNEKIYGVPLDSLAANFAQRYIPQPDPDAVIRGALGLSRESLGYNAEFVYPKQGGIGALANALHAHCRTQAELAVAPEAVHLKDGRIRLNGGDELPFETLVNTIPLPALIELMVRGAPSDVPEAVIDASKKLRANTVLYFDIGIRGTPGPHQDYHWVYFPERDFPFYRVGSYSAVESSLAPEGCRSYYVEMGHVGPVDPTRFVEPVLRGLRTAGIISERDEILFVEPNVLDPAYVLFDDHYERSRQTVLDWLEQTPVITVGRYGRWQYNAMEDALQEGRQAAHQILGRSDDGA